MLSALKEYLAELKSDQSELANDSNSFHQKTINPR